MTLMEALISLGIMAIILVMVDQTFLVNQDVLAKQLAKIDADTGAVLALKRFSDASKGAIAVMSSRTINGTVYTSSASTLVLKLPSIDSSGNIIGSTYDYVAVYRDGTETTKIFTDTQIGTGSVRANGKKLVTQYNTTFTFSYNSFDITQATRVSLFLINTQTARGTTLISKDWTSIFLRNF